jgi:hypothetical protein
MMVMLVPRICRPCEQDEGDMYSAVKFFQEITFMASIFVFR